MKIRRTFTALSAIALFGIAALAGSSAGIPLAQAAPPPGPHGKPEPEMLGAHWAKGQIPAFGRKGTQLLTYHGGPVMGGGTEVRPIFWGSSWPDDTQAKQLWLADFYGGVGASSYMRTNTANDSSTTLNKVSTAV